MSDPLTKEEVLTFIALHQRIEAQFEAIQPDLDILWDEDSSLYFGGIDPRSKLPLKFLVRWFDGDDVGITSVPLGLLWDRDALATIQSLRAKEQAIQDRAAYEDPLQLLTQQVALAEEVLARATPIAQKTLDSFKAKLATIQAQAPPVVPE